MDYDVIVVGARVAGAATAMLLARHGFQVLLVDRGRYGADTLSTHALMRGGVYLLSRWGLLDRIAAAETPPVREVRFDYGEDHATVAIKPAPGVPALYAPRRTLLDPMLVDEATAAGARVRFGVTVHGLLRDGSGRVVGIHGRDRTGAAVTAHAWLVVGADGARSTVSRHANATITHTGSAVGTVIYGYWSQAAADGYEWYYRPGHSAGIIPTNAGKACVFTGMPGRRITDLSSTYYRLLGSATGSRLASAVPPRRLHTWVGRPGFIRQAHGPGWVLVGDAGAFIDPLSTHGITDALRDAELLTRSIVQTGLTTGLGVSLDAFAAARDRVIGPMLPVADQIAGYGWDTAALKSHLLEMSAAMNAELDLIRATS